MNRIATVMKILNKDNTWFIVPWCFVLLPAFLINLAIALIIRPENGFYTGALSSIFIVMMINGMYTLTQSFPFALGLSIRRTDFLLGTVMTVAVVCLGSTGVLSALSFLEGAGGWGIGMHFFNLPYLSNGSLVERWWTLFATAFHMTFLGFFIVAIYRRFGRTGQFAFFTVIFLGGSVLGFLCTYYGWWTNIFHWLTGNSAAQLASWLFVVAVIYVLLSFLMIRKATV
ncbi:hypothetical protein [Neobacillus massiliamazoniensis]|uniref:Uncharacterized protein n=1 Tax=Neobacillus massiliamazoniensis TaxID=1499688 RepID=A0A0U1NYG9_9BACI|nr:hypothetical protein [Neobacillus massiliamazoniensis]CRK83046.1 hypothetical protein BN000_03002 [Neobacillus massiliamazoniensis]